MVWRKKDGVAGEVERSRQEMLRASSKFNFYALWIITALEVAVLVAGVVGLRRGALWARVEDAPEEIVLLVVGMIGFLLFFPLFMDLFYVRHLLRLVMHLEEEVARLKAGAKVDGEERDSGGA